MPVTLDTPYVDIILANNERYKKLTLDEVTALKQQFKESDITNDAMLDVFELTKLYEKRGETQTRIQVKKLLVSVDADNDGKITFEQLLDLFVGKEAVEESIPKEPVKEEIKVSANAKGKLVGKAAFFESAIAQQSNDSSATAAAKEALSKDFEERKRLAGIRKAEEDRVKAEEEQKKKDQEEAKARLANRLKQFEK